jgi:glycosyltransferase involved in cell wall biosynthesis
MIKKTVAILMATYNGEKYISKQIDSILDQKEVNVHLYISDDSSEDNTVNIIEEYKLKFPDNFKKLFHVKFRSPSKNFLSLFAKIPDTYDYYAFSDQDDVWFENKLKNSINKINENYDLYCGRTENVNEDLVTLGYSPLFKNGPDFRNALVQSIAGSNTMVFNNKIFNLIKPSFNFNVPMHDWWIYILTTFVNYKVYYDPIPQLFYRQHQNNFNGSNTGLRNLIKRIISGLKGEYKKNNNINEKNILEFIDYGTKENLKIFYRFQNLRKNSNVLNFNTQEFREYGVYRQTLTGNIMLKLSLILKKA